MPIIDTHCHLDLIENLIGEQKFLEEIKMANEYGISKFITVATNLNNSIELQNRFSGYENINTTVGIHPNEIPNTNSVDEDIEVIQRLKHAAKEPKVVAIGEIGLDILNETTEEEVKKQEYWFKKQIELAILVKKPLIIHCRNAFKRCFELLHQFDSFNLNIIFHCFTGSKQESKYSIDKFNATLSFSGILTFKNAPQVKESAYYAPLSNMVIETDAPFLAPSPYRGKRNELHMIKYTAKMLAELKNIDLEELELYTYSNAHKFFNL